MNLGVLNEERSQTTDNYLLQAFLIQRILVLFCRKQITHYTSVGYTVLRSHYSFMVFQQLINTKAIKPFEFSRFATVSTELASEVFYCRYSNNKIPTWYALVSFSL